MAKVLLVEDTVDLAATIARELELSGYEVWTAADGIRALELHARHRPDLVILDWMLPRLDGLEVLRQLRQTSATPVLMLTARDDEVDRILGLEVGADDYLTKPFSLRELLARVRAMLRRIELFQQDLAADRKPDGQPVRYGPLSLDPVAYQTLYEERRLDLSHTEFDLLYLLLRNPGRAFGRAYLYETVWGEPSLGSDRTVDNAILRLRKKLGSLGDAIETVRGVGYRLRKDPG